jgi:hypothetical protein
VQCAPRPASTGSASAEIPHLRKQGTATQLIVDGKPFLALAGELANNSATSVEYMQAVWPKLVESKLNTVLAGVSWAQIEPQEGKFDFSVPDAVIRDARSHHLHLVFLWFASWKNGMSSYPPAWVKKDFDRFPRARIAASEVPWPVLTISDVPRAKVVGSTSIEMLSSAGDASRDADARAFAALMRHIKAVDGQHTVIMIQVENEVGMQGDSRDRSPVANAAYAGPVPKELMAYLQAHDNTLIPEFRQVWDAAGCKTSGTWEEVFGKNLSADEIFEAWSYARYVGRVAEAGKAEYPLPMFVNAALPRTASLADAVGKGHEYGKAGSRFAIGGPMDDVMDVWRAAAPAIDILSPDAYNDYEAWCARYDRSGNPLFVPESRGGTEGAARLIYAIGRHNAIGYSPMGIDRPETPDADLTASYDLIAQLAPLIAEHQGNGTMSAVLLRGPDDPPQKIQVGNYTLEVSFMSRRRANLEPAPQGPPPPAAAIFIAAGPDEYFAAGIGVIVSFSPNTPGPTHAGLATVEDGSFVNGRWVPGRSMAGDDSDEGNYLMPRKRVQHFTLYRYQ